MATLSDTQMIKRYSRQIEATDGVTLDCLITLPLEFDAIAIIVHGSFNQDKDGNLDGRSKWMFPKEPPKRNLFIDIENYLLTKKIGVIRYDKRASGQSGGVYEDTDIEVLSSDLNAIVQYAKKVFYNRIVLIGHSEGALTATYCQYQYQSVSGLILQGTNFGTLEELLAHQRERAARLFIEGAASTVAAYPYLCALYQSVYRPEFLSLIVDSTQEKAIVSVGTWSHLTNIKKYRQYGTLSVIRMLEAISVPTQIIHGTEDANCSIDYLTKNMGIIEANQNVSVHILEDLDHSFRKTSAITPLIESMQLPIDSDYFGALSRAVDSIIAGAPSYG